jgi:DNA-binding response OmpR family regulator
MRVLVVEDDAKIAGAIKKGLEQESFAVDIAGDGELGYDLAAVEDFDVIVLDLMLPKVDGLEVCRRLRRDEVQAPILMLTARGELSDKVDGLNSGADDYLPKPFAFAELVARVRALARRPRNNIGTVLTAADLTLDTLTGAVRRADEDINLSRKEFALLEYLLKNKERVQTKDQIIDHVWNYDSDVLPNTVEVYVGYLRNKIDKPFPESPPLIRTMRGFGYKVGAK